MRATHGLLLLYLQWDDMGGVEESGSMRSYLRKVLLTQHYRLLLATA